MADFELRPYRGSDEEALIATWNAALPADPVDETVFRRKVILDPNFGPGRLLVAARGQEVLGFCLGVRRQVPLPGADLEPEHSWITAFGVRPDARRLGVGSALLDGAVTALAAAGCTQVAIAPYAPNYFVPGVDEEAYAEGLRFLLARGFRKVADAISMDANIVKLDWAPYAARQTSLAQRGVQVRHLQPTDIPAFLRLLWDFMPPDWVRHALALLDDAARGLAAWRQVSVAVRGEEVVGYCQYEGEHFGPFGVREDCQGQGIGTVLLAHCLQTMRAAGHHNAWVLWTSDGTAAKVYSRFGFTVTRRFAILRRALP